MSDLIDRAAANAALEKLDELMRHRAETEDKEFVKFQVGITLARCEIDAIPTIDAVPVVRCRDCMHSEIHRVRDGLFSETDVRKCELRAFLSIVVDDDDFCSKGERMDADAPARAGR